MKKDAQQFKLTYHCDVGYAGWNAGVLDGTANVIKALRELLADASVSQITIERVTADSEREAEKRAFLDDWKGVSKEDARGFQNGWHKGYDAAARLRSPSQHICRKCGLREELGIKPEVDF